MDRLSPKIVIINYFDELIKQVDIDIDTSIQKLKEDQLFGKLKYFRVKYRTFIFNDNFIFEYFDSNESSQTSNAQYKEVIKWSESTKVIDNLNQIRYNTIYELRKAQEESLEYLKSKSCDLDSIRESKDIEEMKSKLFADKFYFQVLYKPHHETYQDIWIFNLYTFVVDFYLSPSHIEFLE